MKVNFSLCFCCNVLLAAHATEQKNLKTDTDISVHKERSVFALIVVFFSLFI